MKKKMTCFASLLLGLAVALLVACGGGATAPPAGAADAPAAAAAAPAPAAAAPAADAGEAQVEIRAAWWGDTVRHDLYNAIIDGFEAAHPNVTVVREVAGWADYWDRLAIQTAGGNAPDFMGMHPQFAADYIGRGVLAPLDPFIANGAINMSGWSQGVIDTGSVRGTLYMLAMGVTFASQFVNESAILDLGLPLPSLDWTWEERFDLAMQAREIFDSRGEYRRWLIGGGDGALQNFRQFTRQQGFEIYDAEGNIGFPPESVEAFWTIYYDMRNLNLIPDPATGVEFFGLTLEESMFAREMILIHGAPINQFAMQQATFPDRQMGAVRMPRDPNLAVGEFPEGAHFAISAHVSEERQLAAAQLMNHWLNTAEGLYLFRLDQGVPGNEDLHYVFEPHLTDNQMVILDFVQHCFAFATPSTFPPRGASEVDASFVLHAEMVAFGMMTPAEGARAFHDEATAIIARHQAEAD